MKIKVPMHRLQNEILLGNLDGPNVIARSLRSGREVEEAEMAM